MELYRETNIALGSEAIITIVSDLDTVQIRALYNKIWRQIFQFERRFSRFLPNSELSHFNRNGGTRQKVSSDFKLLLESAKRLGIETAGLYNPFVLPALQRAGYTRSFVKGAENDTHEDYSKYGIANVEQLEIGSDWACMPLGAALDLGGCGKGYLADQLVEWLEPLVAGYSISLGGDIICSGLDQYNNPWVITVQQAGAPENTSTGHITMPGRRFAIATSGIAKRRGRQNGRDWHHIIDPRTGTPALADLIQATVCHTSCLHADVLASCAIILGYDDSRNFLSEHGVTQALLQTDTEQSDVLMGNMIKLNATV